MLKIPPEQRVKISVRSLLVQVQQKLGKAAEPAGSRNSGLKHLLQDINMDLEPCKMLAIVGASGSGKSSLLNALAQRFNTRSKGIRLQGSIKYLGADAPHNTAGTALESLNSAYLQQTDEFLAGLTVYETLKYKADLKIPPNVHSSTKEKLILSLLQVLELEHVRGKIIATFASNETTLSGGEQRRVSLAIQLLSVPPLLFLDEPTTGLDASSSLKLILILRMLASPEFGFTILLSIHQPRPEIAVLFDKLCVVTHGGRMVYYGSLIESSRYFANLGFETSHANTLDNIMQLSVKNSLTVEAETHSIMIIEQLVSAWKSFQLYEPFNMSEEEQRAGFEHNFKQVARANRGSISLWQEVVVLTRRSLVTSYRDVGTLIALVGGAALFAVVLGWMFYKPGGSLAGIRSTTSILYVVLEVIGFTPLFVDLERLCNREGTYFFSERKENLVSVPGFLISRRLAKLVVEDIPTSFIFTAISYFMWGLRMENGSGERDASYFFVHLGITFLVYSIGMAMSTLSFALNASFPMASMFANIFYQLQNSACGYFVNAKTMPVYVKWTKYIAPFWYAFGALTANQYTDWMGACKGDGCETYSGNYQLHQLGYPKNWVNFPAGILVAWLCGFYVFAAMALYFNQGITGMAKHKTNRIGDGSGLPLSEKAENQQIGSETVNDAAYESFKLSLDNVSLRIHSGISLFKKGSKSTDLLDNVCGDFIGSQVNAIMGPSGSGKSSLLKLLSNRFPHSTSKTVSGRFTINHSTDVRPLEIAKISAFVDQNDDVLIPTLTVRETLYYQALLRLPKDKKHMIPSIIVSIMRKVGLLECADIMVGSSLRKGISGGEKRRLSIAVQLLSNPKVLFLDEPTSGLDSATASMIMAMLGNLASQNRTTIILTIHQPNEEIFHQFGSVLLLAKHGTVVYQGQPGNVESYLRLVGHVRPESKNTSDFMLDLLSPTLNEDPKNTEARIQVLRSEWLYHQIKLVDYEKNTGKLDLKSFERTRAPFFVALKAITSRQFLNSWRSFDIIIARAFQTIFLAIVHTVYFTPLRNNQDGISNRLGLVQEVLNLYFVGLINNISLYPVERDLFHKEYKDGIYGTLEFSISYLLNELPIEILSCLFFAALVVFGPGLPREVGVYFSMFLTGFVAVNCGESLGTVVNSIF